MPPFADIEMLRDLDDFFDYTATLSNLNPQNQPVATVLDRQALELAPGESLRARYLPALAGALQGVFGPDGKSVDTILINRAVRDAKAGQSIEIEKRDAKGNILTRKRFSVQDAIITEAGLTAISAAPVRRP